MAVQLLSQLVNGGCAGKAIRGDVSTAREADRGIRLGKRIHTIEEDARRSAEPHALSFLDRVDQVSRHGDLRELLNEFGDVLIGNLPVGAALEVLQRDFHTLTVNIEVHLKVKR